jgi:hypothetical protein
MIFSVHCYRFFYVFLQISCFAVDVDNVLPKKHFSKICRGQSGLSDLRKGEIITWCKKLYDSETLFYFLIAFLLFFLVALPEIWKHIFYYLISRFNCLEIENPLDAMKL